MPRTADHEERRAVLATAVLQLIQEQGVASLSVRNVARRAGWTTGIVQHYFPSKDALLRHAFELISEQALRRTAEAVRQRPAAEAHIATFEVFLPLAEDVRAEIEVWFAFLGLALPDPVLRQVASEGHRALTAEMARQLRRAQRAGAVREDLDIETAAREVMALADGFSVQALFLEDDADLPDLRDLAVRRLLDIVAAPASPVV